jgi:hypothetical protein
MHGHECLTLQNVLIFAGIALTAAVLTVKFVFSLF